MRVKAHQQRHAGVREGPPSQILPNELAVGPFVLGHEQNELECRDANAAGYEPLERLCEQQVKVLGDSEDFANVHGVHHSGTRPGRIQRGTRNRYAAKIRC